MDSPGSTALGATRTRAEIGSRPRVVSLTADYPDPVDGFKTAVVRTLLDLTAEDFAHQVFSLNRQTPGPLDFGRSLLLGWGKPRLSLKSVAFDAGEALIYEAPGRGLYHATMLRQLGDWLANRLLVQGQPALLVGHKLTIEGIAVRRAAGRLGVPYAVSIQGDTDTKILDARPDLVGEFRRVYHEADVVFPFTPWAFDRFEKRLGKRQGKTVMLPCPTELDTPLAPRAGGDGLLSVFHLKNWRRKNVPGMMSALRLLGHDDVETALTIIGGGSEDDVRHTRSLAGDMPNVVVAGPLGRQEVRERMNRATAFVLPSMRETFGLVFLEALFAGLPIIYPKGQAVDGYFDDAPFALAVDARKPEDIATAMRRAVNEEASIKASLRDWQTSSEAKRFTRPEIERAFAQGLASAMTAL